MQTQAHVQLVERDARAGGQPDPYSVRAPVRSQAARAPALTRNYSRASARLTRAPRGPSGLLQSGRSAGSCTALHVMQSRCCDSLQSGSARLVLCARADYCVPRGGPPASVHTRLSARPGAQAPQQQTMGYPQQPPPQAMYQQGPPQGYPQGPPQGQYPGMQQMGR